ncbi:MAG TPA: VOC family protein [Polyangiaceae bacterium]|jgi:extradiol dioxygenase family protein
MAVTLDHLIVNVRSKQESATFLAEMLGLAAPVPVGHFLAVKLDNGLSLDFCEREVHPQHYAFEVSEAEFDAVLARARARKLPYWADPQQTRPGEVAQRGTGRALYFCEPSGHWLEVLTNSNGA